MKPRAEADGESLLAGKLRARDFFFFFVCYCNGNLDGNIDDRLNFDETVVPSPYYKVEDCYESMFMIFFFFFEIFDSFEGKKKKKKKKNHIGKTTLILILILTLSSPHLLLFFCFFPFSSLWLLRGRINFMLGRIRQLRKSKQINI